MSEALVTPQEVKSIMRDNVVENRLVPFIEDAHIVVVDNLLDSGYPEVTLKSIEKNLSAHFATLVIYPLATRAETLDSNATYNRPKGEGLHSTPYGQSVLNLDNKSILSNLGTKQGVFRTMTYSREQC